MNGPYSQGYDYDQWGNLTHRFGWGGEVQGGSAGQSSDLYYTYTNGKNQRDGFTYDAAGNLTNDTAQSFTYDATGQQASSTLTNLQQAYDSDGLRVRKSDSTTGVTYYLRSSVLGGQVVGQLVNVGGVWQWNQGYVYLGGQLLATQHYGVNFVHEDPVTKSKRVTDMSGNVLSTVETDPWGADTNRSGNAAFQPRKFTSYERDANGSDDAMFRRYNRRHSRFDQPDPYDGSYNLSNPQSLNRYVYVQNDPVNFVDPSGLDLDPITITVIGNVDSAVRGGTGGSLAGLGGRDGTIVDELLVEVGSGVDVTGTGPQQTAEHPHSEQGNLPFNNCYEFVDFLVKEAAYSLSDNFFGSKTDSKAKVLGVHMMDLAFNGYGRHINNGFAGFKDTLTAPGAGTAAGAQGAGVYGHVLGQGGATLAGIATMAIAGLADAYDNAQNLFGHEQGPAEVAGNKAGGAVGKHIQNFLSGTTPREAERLRNSLRSELCK